MKALIVDIKGKYAAALTANGMVQRIPDNKYTVGDEVNLAEIIPIRRPPKPAAKIIRRVSIIAAAIITLTALGFGTAYAVPCGTVSLDADPSIEYTINCFDYVLDVKALNEDGKNVLAELEESSLRHHKIDDAVAKTVEQIEKDGYLNRSAAGVGISANTGNDNRNEQIKQDLENKVSGEVNQPQISKENESAKTPDTLNQEQPAKENPTDNKAFTEPENGQRTEMNGSIPNAESHQPYNLMQENGKPTALSAPEMQ